VTHLYANDLYYAHLSLYAFAARWARGAAVLDVGCGSGYGGAYLARHGARHVTGVDVDPGAVAFAARHWGADIRFEVMEASRLAELGAHRFDLVVVLNVLEHLSDVPAVLAGACATLRPSGTLIAAVPPVTSAEQRLAELANPHHVNIWSPRQWRHCLGAYFETVELYRHVLTRPDVVPDFRNAPPDTVLSERDFDCLPAIGEGQLAGSFSVVLLARGPMEARRRPPPGAKVMFVDDSFTRVRPWLTPLAPDLLAAEALPLRSLPARAWAEVRAGGPPALLRATRAWLSWRVRRGLALRELRRPPPTSGAP